MFRLDASISSHNPIHGVHGQRKSQGNSSQIKIKGKSGNFEMGQGIFDIHMEVREKSGDFIYVITCVKSLNRKTG